MEKRSNIVPPPPITRIPDNPKALSNGEFHENYMWTQTILQAVQSTQDTAIYAWGDGRDGALGIGASRVQRQPIVITGLLKNETICAISAGWKLSLFLNDRGQVFQCGKLFEITGSADLAPERLIFPSNKIVIRTIEAGLQAAFAVDVNGVLYSWGKGTHGQLGYKLAEGEEFSPSPRPLQDIDFAFVLDISTGEAHTLAIADINTERFGISRSLWSWGKNVHGCLGLVENREPYVVKPTELVGLRNQNIEKVAAGSDHSLVMTIAGLNTYVFSFGSNLFGQLGTESTDTDAVPRAIRELMYVNVVEISAGNRFSVALSDTGEVYSCGDGAYGKTAQEGGRITIVPWYSSILAPYSAVGITAGKDHCIILARTASKKMDRFRNIAIPDVQVILSPEHIFGSKSAPCKCSHNGLSFRAPCSLMYTCVDCSTQNLCRHCARYCHADHEIFMMYSPVPAGKDNITCQCAVPCRMFLPHVTEDEEDIAL